ncbi:DUF421 domain-containing protein [Chengkuizengella axinellae]|uniref:DUF421 domain-containing protein n=1 Tax=Chengkuizengella axinellae TaxID=3064388 RepID=A0ABT9J372_9BACL|nr:DUF421 domain-containing protein [Chengkuizengella sp. 2205SS18-9]MDP5275460.1 DUF421 domain-containing protein [Chengkuizengella sp. 2205SS18-9]
MDYFKDFLIIIVRIFTIFPLLLIMALYMGKRSVGELPVFDFLIVIAIGAVVGADIADPKIEHLPTALAIVLIGLLQRYVSKLMIKSSKFGKIITFEPRVVIHKGNLIKENLKKERYSIDNILQMLREKDIFNMEEVEMAVLESSGKLSVYKKPNKSAVTLEDLGLEINRSQFAYPIILDGVVSEKVLAYLQKDMKWLDTQLQNQNTRKEDVFYASVNEKLHLHVSKETPIQVPPMEH